MSCRYNIIILVSIPVIRDDTGVRVLCRRQCVSIGRPNATAMRLPPYVLHSRGFYRGKTPPPAPPTPSDRYVGRRRRSAGRRKSFGPGDAGAGAQSHPPLECWPRARVRAIYTHALYTRRTMYIPGDPFRRTRLILYFRKQRLPITVFIIYVLLFCQYLYNIVL